MDECKKEEEEKEEEEDKQLFFCRQNDGMEWMMASSRDLSLT
jgi:hypothetical protein